MALLFLIRSVENKHKEANGIIEVSSKNVNNHRTNTNYINNNNRNNVDIIKNNLTKCPAIYKKEINNNSSINNTLKCVILNKQTKVDIEIKKEETKKIKQEKIKTKLKENKVLCETFLYSAIEANKGIKDKGYKRKPPAGSVPVNNNNNTSNLIFASKKHKLEKFIEKYDDHENELMSEKIYYCPHDNTVLLPSNGNNYECPSCGYLKEIRQGNRINDSHYCNNINKPTVNISLAGEDKYYNKKFTTEAGFTSRNSIEDDLNSYNNKSHIKFPSRVINYAAEVAFRVLSQESHRHNPRKGILSAAIRLACIEKDSDISRTDEELVRFTNTDERFLAVGIRAIEQVLNISFTELLIKSSEKNNYVDRYIELLNVDSKYKNNVLTLIELAEVSGRFIGQNPNTIWAGSFCYIYEFAKIKVKKSMIQETKITISTFNNFGKVIRENLDEFSEAFP